MDDFKGIVIDLDDGSMEQHTAPAEVQQAVLDLISTWPQDYFHRNPNMRAEFAFSFAFLGDAGDELPGFELNHCYAVILASSMTFLKNKETQQRTRQLIATVQEHCPASIRVAGWEVVFFPQQCENMLNRTELMVGIRRYLQAVK